MVQCSHKLDSFEELVAKAVEAKAKAVLQPASYARETDHRCFQGSRPAYTAKTKDLKPENPKFRLQKSKELNLQHTESAESSEKAQKEEKKKWIEREVIKKIRTKTPPWQPGTILSIPLVAKRKRRRLIKH